MANETEVLRRLVKGEIKTEEQRDEALALLDKKAPAAPADKPAATKGPAKKK